MTEAPNVPLGSHEELERLLRYAEEHYAENSRGKEYEALGFTILFLALGYGVDAATGVDWAWTELVVPGVALLLALAFFGHNRGKTRRLAAEAAIVSRTIESQLRGEPAPTHDVIDAAHRRTRQPRARIADTLADMVEAGRLSVRYDPSLVPQPEDDEPPAGPGLTGFLVVGLASSLIYALSSTGLQRLLPSASLPFIGTPIAAWLSLICSLLALFVIVHHVYPLAQLGVVVKERQLRGQRPIGGWAFVLLGLFAATILLAIFLYPFVYHRVSTDDWLIASVLGWSFVSASLHVSSYPRLRRIVRAEVPEDASIRGAWIGREALVHAAADRLGVAPETASRLFTEGFHAVRGQLRVAVPIHERRSRTGGH